MDIFLTFESPTFVFYPPAPNGSNNGEPGGIVVGRFEYWSERVKKRDHRPTITPLQIAYENQKDSNLFARIPAEIHN